jgi:hypothetical protein
MTEAEWLACAEPEAPLLYLTESEISHRKVRLFGWATKTRR